MNAEKGNAKDLQSTIVLLRMELVNANMRIYELEQQSTQMNQLHSQRIFALEFQLQKYVSQQKSIVSLVKNATSDPILLQLWKQDIQALNIQSRNNLNKFFF